MLTPKYVIPTSHQAPPLFVTTIMQAVRSASEKDSVIRIRMDSSAKTVVALTAQWVGAAIRDIQRRVFVETKLDKDGNCSVVFMTKLFDENAVTRTYPVGQASIIATDILRYLRMGHLPEA